MEKDSTLYRLNHLHIEVNPKVNLVLINIMTVCLILYCVTGIVQFMGPSVNPWPFYITYTVSTIIGVCMLVFYRDRPFAAVGLYMLVIGMDRVISWMIGVPMAEEGIMNILELIVSLWIVLSSITWFMGRIPSRYPTMISTLVLIAINVWEIVWIVQNPDAFGYTPLPFISTILQFIMYTMLIVILVINDTSTLKREDVSILPEEGTE